MTPFHVGMRVVCVDDQWQGGVWYLPCPLKAGEVYFVNAIVVEPGIYKDGISNTICLILNGVINPYHSFSSGGFDARRFRPAHENRMDELRTLLAPVPSKAKTLSPVQS